MDNRPETNILPAQAGDLKEIERLTSHAIALLKGVRQEWPAAAKRVAVQRREAMLRVGVLESRIAVLAASTPTLLGRKATIDLPGLRLRVLAPTGGSLRQPTRKAEVAELHEFLAAHHPEALRLKALRFSGRSDSGPGFESMADTLGLSDEDDYTVNLDFDIRQLRSFLRSGAACDGVHTSSPEPSASLKLPDDLAAALDDAALAFEADPAERLIAECEVDDMIKTWAADRLRGTLDGRCDSAYYHLWAAAAVLSQEKTTIALLDQDRDILRLHGQRDEAMRSLSFATDLAREAVAADSSLKTMPLESGATLSIRRSKDEKIEVLDGKALYKSLASHGSDAASWEFVVSGSAAERLKKEKADAVVSAEPVMAVVTDEVRRLLGQNVAIPYCRIESDSKPRIFVDAIESQAFAAAAA